MTLWRGELSFIFPHHTVPSCSHFMTCDLFPPLTFSFTATDRTHVTSFTHDAHIMLHGWLDTHTHTQVSRYYDTVELLRWRWVFSWQTFCFKCLKFYFEGYIFSWVAYLMFSCVSHCLHTLVCVCVVGCVSPCACTTLPCLAECCVTIPAWDHCEVWLSVLFLLLHPLPLTSCLCSVILLFTLSHTSEKNKDKMSSCLCFVWFLLFNWWTIQSNR